MHKTKFYTNFLASKVSIKMDVVIGEKHLLTRLVLAVEKATGLVLPLADILRRKKDDLKIELPEF